MLLDVMQRGLGKSLHWRESDLCDKTPSSGHGRSLTTSDAWRIDMFEQTFKNIDDVLWKEAGCTTELDYT